MNTLKKICVYCGSSFGKHEEYKNAARLLGHALVSNNIDLVYGGSKVGLMGETANEVLRLNGKVTGIIPYSLSYGEMVHDNLTELIKTSDMRERKKKMSDISDGFIALPGGLGTYEELFEMLSWAQLGIHQKPIGLLNTLHFYDPLLAMLEKTKEEGFMYDTSIDLVQVSDNPSELIKKMQEYTPPSMQIKWKQAKNPS